jgi:hypothetical protein
MSARADWQTERQHTQGLAHQRRLITAARTASETQRPSTSEREARHGATRQPEPSRGISR